MKESNNLELWVFMLGVRQNFEYLPVDVAFQSVQHSEACLLGLTLLHSARQNLRRFSDFRHESFMYVR